MRTASRYKERPAGTSGELARRDGVLSFVGTEAQVQKSGMTFPSNLPERSWERIGADLHELSNSSAWWLADWLIFGESTYGWRRYQEAIQRTGLDYQTLRNYAWVARRFEQHRRRDSLSFAHHAEVTRLSRPEQDYWLRKAEQLKWSRNELRRAVRASLAEQAEQVERSEQSEHSEQSDRTEQADRTDHAGQADRHRPEATTTLTIELSAGRLDAYAKLAAAHGLSVDQWVTQVLDAADRPSL